MPPFSFSLRDHQRRRDDLVKQIGNDLWDQQCGPDAAKFVPITAIEDILTEAKLHTLFAKLAWYEPKRVTNIWQHSKIIIAILIRAGWTQWDRLPDFLCPHKDKTFDPTTSPNIITDISLPIPESTLIEFEKRYQGQRIRQFDAYQYDFLPVIIREDTYGKYPERARLPYVDKPQPIGFGAFGTVYKVTIAKRYLARGLGYRDSNEKDCVMAVKVYKSEGTRDTNFGADFDREQTILKKFKAALISVSAVAKNFAAFVHGDDLNIISDLADMDLAALLSGECRGFESYAANSTTLCPYNLICEAWSLFDAMAYLHNGISLAINQREEIVHMDLKPDNILIFGPLGEASHPVGRWKIADFNLAESSDLSLSQPRPKTRRAGLTLGGLIREKSTRPGREGAYLPPELRNRHQLQADKKTDVWSLGCIMANLLAFATGGVAGVEEMRKSLISPVSPRDDYFYDIAQDGQASLKQSFLNWLNSSLSWPRDEDWIRCWRDLILSMLEIDRTTRCQLRNNQRFSGLAERPSAIQKLEIPVSVLLENVLLFGRGNRCSYTTWPFEDKRLLCGPMEKKKYVVGQA